ncbi:MAG TPA: NAD(P)-dependent oxidoreductase [Nocardioidaceae bacterium]|nr:NAD(P)-dependent oxidoreductase [Nocardioidaceae bacterium]
MSLPRVAAIGVGLLGSALTATLLDRGYNVAGYDPDPRRIAEHEARGGRGATSIADAVDGVDRVLLALPTGDIVREACLGPGGVADVAAPGTLVLDATTARPSDSIGTGRTLAERGIGFLDTSVSGSSAMAWERDIVIMVGGPDDDVARARPVLEALARSVRHVGPLGAGTRTKLIVNLALGVHRLVLAEALVLGERAGLDLDRLLEVLKDSAAYSKAMDGWGERMVRGDHDRPRSRIRQHAKDVGLMLDEGAAVGAPMPLTRTLAGVLDQALDYDLADADNSAVIAVLRRLAGEDP